MFASLTSKPYIQQNSISIENAFDKDTSPTPVFQSQKSETKDSFRDSFINAVKVNESRIHPSNDYFVAQRSSSHVPSSRLAQFQPKEEVRSLLDEMKKKYKVNKREDKSFESSSGLKNALSHRDVHPKSLLDRDNSTLYDYSQMHQPSRTPAARPRYSFIETSSPFPASRTQATPGSYHGYTADTMTVPATSEKFRFPDRTKPDSIDSSYRNYYGNLNTQPKNSAAILDDIRLSQTRETNIRSSQQLNGSRDYGNLNEHYRDANPAQNQMKVSQFRENNMKSSQQLDKSRDEYPRKESVSLGGLPNKLGRSQSNTNKYDSKKVDDIINRILKVQTSPQASPIETHKPHSQTTTNAEQPKKRSIFSSSMFLKKVPQSEEPTVIADHHPTQEQTQQETTKQLPEAGSSSGIEPVVHKARNIFSKFVEEDSLRVIKKPLRPSSSSEQPTNYKRSSVNLPKKQTAEENTAKIDGSRISEKNENTDIEKQPVQELASETKLIENNRKAHRGDVEYSCCDMENDDDSVILKLIEQDVYRSLNHIPERKYSNDSNRQKFRKEAVSMQETETVRKSPYQNRRDSRQKASQALIKVVESRRKTISDNDGELQETENTKRRQSPNHKSFEEDFSVDEPQTRNSQKNIFTNTIERKREKILSKESSTNKQQTFGVEGSQSDVESGFESQPAVEQSKKSNSTLKKEVPNPNQTTQQLNSDMESPLDLHRLHSKEVVMNSSNGRNVSTLAKSQSAASNLADHQTTQHVRRPNINNRTPVGKDAQERNRINSSSKKETRENGKVSTRSIAAKGLTSAIFQNRNLSMKLEHPNAPDISKAKVTESARKQSGSLTTRNFVKTEMPKNGSVHSRPLIMKL